VGGNVIVPGFACVLVKIKFVVGKMEDMALLSVFYENKTWGVSAIYGYEICVEPKYRNPVVDAYRRLLGILTLCTKVVFASVVLVLTLDAAKEKLEKN
jgi:hypothetical protein